MSHDQLRPSSETNSLPPIEKTAKPDPQFQFQQGEGMSAQKVAEKQAKKEKKLKRLKRTAIGSAGLMAASVVFALAAPKLIGGESSSNEPDLSPEPGSSAPAVPGEVDPTVAPELPTTLDDKNVMYSFEELGNTGEAAQGNFTLLLSDVINDRLDNGGEPLEDDLDYFVSSNAMPQVDAFVRSYVSHLNDERNKASEAGYEGTVDLSIANQYGPSEQDGNGFSNTSTMEMVAVDSESGDILGYVTSNLETYTTTFSATKFELADGTTQDAIMIDSFEQQVSQP